MATMRPCILSPEPAQSGAAALACVAAASDLALSLWELGQLVPLGSLTYEMREVLIAGRMLGFEAIPLEGSFDELQEVPRPNLVVFREQEQTRFAVLYEIEPGAAVIADPVVGRVEHLDREEFCRRWTGDCVSLVPNLDRLAETRARLADLRRPFRRIRAALGFAPPRLPKLGLAIVIALGLLAVGMGAVRVPPSAPSWTLAGALGLAMSLSAWLWLFGPACASCSRVHMLAGSAPFDSAGLFFYAGLLGAAFLPAFRPFLPALVCLALGAHVGLVGWMLWSKLTCLPCIATALSALSAALLLSTELSVLDALGPLLVGTVSSCLAIPIFQRLGALRSMREAEALGLSALRGSPADRVKVTVFKRRTCPECLYYEAILRPALKQEFGPALTIEDREVPARAHAPTPLIVVAGTMRFLFVGLPPGENDRYDALRVAVLAAQNPRLQSLGELSPLFVIKGSG